MTLEIITVLLILIAVVVFLVTELMPLEVLAFLVLGVLAVSGIVTPAEALSGFSSPAVVTIWAVFILSGGLTRTGIANILGRQLLKVAGRSSFLLIVVIMAVVGILSAFMNNVAVAALMLPVVMDITRKTDHSAAKLLLPLAYGSLLGGLTTMIGTPPNILVSEALRENGLKAFSLFDFTPVGLTVMVSGMAFIALIGTRLLPGKETNKTGSNKDFRTQYELQERLFQIRIPSGSALAGKTLAKSRLGSVFGLNVIGIKRGKHTLLAPEISEIIRAEDVLIVEGRIDQIQEMNHWGQLELVDDDIDPDALYKQGIKIAGLRVAPGSTFVDRTFAETGFRGRFGLNVLAVKRNNQTIDEDIKNQTIKPDDILIVYGPEQQIDLFENHSDFILTEKPDASDVKHSYPLDERVRRFKIPENSGLIGMSLRESRLGDIVDIQILCIIRQDRRAFVPKPEDRFEAGDRLIVSGSSDMVSILLMKGLEGIFVRDTSFNPDKSVIEDDHVGFMEVTLSPHSKMPGLTLGKMQFREKFGLTVMAIWRKGKVFRTGLRDIALEFGDALLVYGHWKKLHILGHEPDFLVLTEKAQDPPREEKAKIALAIMAAVLLPVIMDWIPIYIAVVMGAAFMVLTKCLTMEEAYRYIEWKAVFLIAGMLPLGTALSKTGAAGLMAEGVVNLLGPFGPNAVLAGLIGITFLATSIIPTSALVILMVPIVLKTSADLGISPYPLMMGIAMAASSSFTSPISHPANVLVMGPGGYRFIDYIKVGVPLTILVFLVLMIVLPILWPLTQ